MQSRFTKNPNGRDGAPHRLWLRAPKRAAKAFAGMNKEHQSAHARFRVQQENRRVQRENPDGVYDAFQTHEKHGRRDVTCYVSKVSVLNTFKGLPG